MKRFPLLFIAQRSNCTALTLPYKELKPEFLRKAVRRQHYRSGRRKVCAFDKGGGVRGGGLDIIPGVVGQTPIHGIVPVPVAGFIVPHVIARLDRERREARAQNGARGRSRKPMGLEGLNLVYPHMARIKKNLGVGTEVVS